MKLLDLRNRDGSRHFASFPRRVSATTLRAHLGRLEGVTVGELLTDRLTEDWLDFTYDDYGFTVNAQFGPGSGEPRYWFFVDQPDAPEEVLQRVAAHARTLLGDS